MALRSPKEYILRPNTELDAELIERCWQSVEEARAALALPVPSTFLGRDIKATQQDNRGKAASECGALLREDD
jgi:hypothetical protein